jgi:N-dimethylarginine dimethylaminohydrolase
MQQLTRIKKIEPQTGPGFKGKAALVEGIDLGGIRTKCNSEDGQLKIVAVQQPDSLFWTPESAINTVQAKNAPPPKDLVKMEHELLVNALVSEGAHVIIVKAKDDLPEGVYQRDSLGVIGTQAFSAAFKFQVRQKEAGIIKGARSPWKDGEIIEFGDVLVFPDAVLVGLGDRTNRMALETLAHSIDKEVIPVPLKAGTLHLDYATTIGGRGAMKTMVVCPDLYADKTMVELIVKRFNIRNVISVPEEKHASGWTNLFFINPETVISTTAAKGVNDQLRKTGFKVVEIPFDGILAGEGAPRCCTAPLLRED